MLDKDNKVIVCDTDKKTKFKFEGNVWGKNGALRGGAYADAINAGWVLSSNYTVHTCPKCAAKAAKAKPKKSTKKAEKKSSKPKKKAVRLTAPLSESNS